MPDAVRIKHRAGYGKLNDATPPVWVTDSVPEPIRIAVLMHVGALFRARDEEAELPAARSLLEPYRIWSI